MNKHSMTAFLNSLLLEIDCKVFREKEIILYLGEKSISIPLKKYSSKGKHQYGDFDFGKVFEEILSGLAAKFHTPFEQVQKFKQRVLNSNSNITKILSHRSDLTQLMSRKLTFIEAEQLLYIGHAFHPTPKSRDEFSDSDFIDYSPEMKSEFPLKWLIISKTIFFEKHSGHFTDLTWLADLFSEEFSGEEVPSDYVPYPFHPWQWEQLKTNEIISSYLKNGSIKEVRTGNLKWAPTSSLRTLYCKSSKYMLKFSMNVKLTNSVRHLFVHELDRGLQVHEVMNHREGKSFTEKNPEFRVIHEPVYAGILDRNQNIISETLILGRENPFQNDEEAIVVAALTQDEGHAVIRKDSRENAIKWFNDFLKVAIRPLIKAQADYGILLGSHQQNMVLEIKDGYPVKSYFRDCNGTGYSRLGHELFKSIDLIQEENGNILDDAPASFLFGYYVIINSTFNVLSSVAASGQVSEEDLLNEFRSFIQALKDENPRDPSFIQYLLNSKHLMHKGNFLCSFRNINENTQKNPLSIYTKIKNPMIKDHHMTSLPEVTYKHLTSNETMKASFENNICKVKTDTDKVIESEVTFNESFMLIKNLKAQSDLLATQVEYLLSHIDSVKEVRLENCELPELNKSFQRSEFYQLPLLWHHSSSYKIKPEVWTMTNDRHHPVRPAPFQGTMYKRYLPKIGKTISFRLITLNDLDTFHDWHNQPRVYHFWELNQSKEELKAYIEKGLKDPHQIPVIVEMDGEPMGYFEFYWVREDRLGPYYDSDAFDRGFHFLIGNKKFLGNAITDQVIKSVLHLLFLDDARTRRVMAEPRHDNQKVLKYAQASIGWKQLKIFDFPHKRAALLENSREVFFGGNAL